MEKVKGIIQWVSKSHGLKCEVRQYDRLFKTPLPGKDHEDGDFLKDLNPDSLQVLKTAIVEPSLANIAAGTHVQFERVGYFYSDPLDSKAGNLVFNRVVTLRDNWSAQATAAPAASAAAKGEKGRQQQTDGAPAVGGGGGDIENIRRLDIRVGKILSAEQHPDAESLYVEQIDVGDKEGPRTIVSGLAKHIPLAELQGRMCTVLCNLKPAKMRGVVSGGMVLCGANEATNTVELLEPPPGAKVGERITVEGFGAPDPDPELKSKTQQKVWPSVAPDLKADAKGEARYQGKQLKTSAGPLKCKSLIDCLIG
jgi:aminoacyl tRNA synthase complex-interacting multifunctional protein 1